CSAMRQILVNHAKSRLTGKRGGARAHVSIDDVQPVHEEAEEIVALPEALDALHAIDPRKSRAVRMSYFGALRAEDTAGALAISVRTVERGWSLARSWLIREMKRGSS